MKWQIRQFTAASNKKSRLVLFVSTDHQLLLAIMKVSNVSVVMCPILQNLRAHFALSGWLFEIWRYLLAPQERGFYIVGFTLKFIKPKEKISESKLYQLLPRSLDTINAALTDMLSRKITEFIGSRTIEISLPRSFSVDDVSEEGK